jgi:hypothetical protein
MYYVSTAVDRQHILDEIRRTAKANCGVPLGKSRFEQETGIRYYDWFGRFWQDGATLSRKPASRLTF